jgi:hypothetical protein
LDELIEDTGGNTARLGYGNFGDLLEQEQEDTDDPNNQCRPSKAAKRNKRKRNKRKKKQANGGEANENGGAESYRLNAKERD